MVTLGIFEPTFSLFFKLVLVKILQLIYNCCNTRVKVNVFSNHEIHILGVNILDSIEDNSITSCENIDLHELETVKDPEIENSPTEYVYNIYNIILR